MGGVGVIALCEGGCLGEKRIVDLSCEVRRRG